MSTGKKINTSTCTYRNWDKLQIIRDILLLATYLNQRLKTRAIFFPVWSLGRYKISAVKKLQTVKYHFYQKLEKKKSGEICGPCILAEEPVFWRKLSSTVKSC